MEDTQLKRSAASASVEFESLSGQDRHVENTLAPPAPKRRKDSPRIRASRACDRCKARKTRCSGKNPCVFCLQLGVTCKYTAPYRRGRPPVIEPGGVHFAGDMNLLETVGSRMSPSEGFQGSSAPAHLRESSVPLDPSPTELQGEHDGCDGNDGSRVQFVDDGLPSDIEAGRAPALAVIPSSRNSPEPLQTDRQGHMVGPASGVSFLLRLQRKVASHTSQFSSDSSIFTFGDLPLAETDNTFFILPSKSEARELTKKYFDFAAATHRFLHRGTIEQWVEELYETGGKMRVKEGSRSRVALIFMVFAQAQQFLSPIEPEASVRFFSAAEQQLSEEKGEIRLTSVQARLCQCFYLLSQSRINHCWSLFGTLGRLVLALGIHRKGRRSDAARGDIVESECRKRTFWVAYNLDIYLSAALGRPRAFHDEDVNQDLPACVDDVDLDMGRLTAAPDRSLPEMAAPIAQFNISHIMSNILREFYSLRSPTNHERLRLAAEMTRDLVEWRESMAVLLDQRGAFQSLLLPLFQRQRNVLNLAYWHALLLVHRPFLLSIHTSLTGQDGSSAAAARARAQVTKNQEAFKENVIQCLDAAMQITRIVDEMGKSGLLSQPFWFTYYFASCAVVVLYVYTIQQAAASPQTYLEYFDAAARCQARIMRNAREGSLIQRYGAMLEDLRLEVLRHNRFLLDRQARGMNMGSGNPARALPTSDSGIGSSSMAGDISFAQAPTQAGLGTSLAALGGAGIDTAASLHSPDVDPLTGSSPSSSMLQMAGWGQFDSLVTGGFGGLDTVLADPEAGWAWV